MITHRNPQKSIFSDQKIITIEQYPTKRTAACPFY